MWNKKEEEVIPNQEEKLILRAAIDRAEKNGYQGHVKYLPVFINPKGDKKEIDKKLDKLANDTFYYHGRQIIFDIPFIKAFFPEGETDEKRNVLKDWKYHTEEMLKRNPIKYIESYL